MKSSDLFELGTGRTTSILIGALHLLNSEDTRTCQVLILVSARDLAQTILRSLKEIGTFMNVKAHALIGGAAVRDDIRTLQEGEGVQIIVGTPGRVFDMINRGLLKVDGVKMFVLEEIDEILSRGFNEVVLDVQKHLPQSCQCVMTATSNPPDVRELSRRFLCNPIVIRPDVSDARISAPLLYLTVNDGDVEGDEGEQGKGEGAALFDMKMRSLLHCLTIVRPRVLVFCKDPDNVRVVHEKLVEQGLSVFSVSNSDQHPGEEEQFREEIRKTSEKTVFILSDKDISLLGDEHRYGNFDVVNFDLATTSTSFVLRNGRKGCFGRNFAMVSLLLKAEIPQLIKMSKAFGVPCHELSRDHGYY